MSRTQIHVGVAITPLKLTKLLADANKLPDNYEIRKYTKKGFETMLKMSKPTIMTICDSSGVCDFNVYLQPESQEEPEFLVILKRKFANKP